MQHVNVFLSGGLDSAITAAHLKKQYDVRAFVFNFANAIPYANILSGILDLDLEVIHVKVLNDRKEIFRALEHAVTHYDNDIYLGLTALPPIPMGDPDQYPDRYSQAQVETHPRIKAPFADWTKAELLKFGYETVDCIDDLVYNSHTCYIKPIGRCGWCFNCLERQWAFDEIGKRDEGIA